MKSILQFIHEAQENSKEFKFAFAGLGEEATKGLEELASDNVAVSNNVVTVKATEGDDSQKDVVTAISAAIKKAAGTFNRSADEPKAQILAALERQIKALSEYVNAEPEAEEPAEEPAEDTEAEEEKK